MSLQTVEEIERAIGTLAPSQIEDLYAWLDRNFPPVIDSSIPSGLATGRLDNAILRALEDEADGRLHLESISLLNTAVSGEPFGAGFTSGISPEKLIAKVR